MNGKRGRNVPGSNVHRHGAVSPQLNSSLLTKGSQMAKRIQYINTNQMSSLALNSAIASTHWTEPCTDRNNHSTKWQKENIKILQ